MNFFFPDLKALCMAENCCHTMHNLVPIRGAQARDALQWSKYINEVIELFGADTDVMFASHHWPRWGVDDVRDFLFLQRDLYKWIHDQTMRHANHGYTGPEIAALLEMPDDFLENSHTRGYYGDLIHNVKAVYQRYLSWYDGNPARLNPHPPVEAARRYVDAVGGPDALLKKAQAAFDKGDYRWVAELVNHLVFAEPSNVVARNLQADALEQLGYQTESSTFRNAYLTGAQELRHGVPNLGDARARGKGMIRAMNIEQMFDTIAVRLMSEKVGGLKVTINWHFSDINEHWVLELSHRTLHATPNKVAQSADATVTIARTLMLSIMNQETTFVDELQAGTVTIDGDAAALLTIFGNLDLFLPGFAIVEP
jgi:alkyl sulfatase BDS1-like metallo-beta-lactamase superfamily hydrolase